jgi:hypothetical protein
MESRPKADLVPAYDALSVWENEGAALEPPSHPEASCDANSDDILVHLGMSVVSHWESLPVQFRRTVFRKGAISGGGPSSDLKARMARFLHANKREIPSGGAT